MRRRAPVRTLPPMGRSLSVEGQLEDRTDAVSCRALTKRFGDTIAVDSLDLSVTRGETFGFLGPNGAGKTTTLRMLLGLVRPTSGVARLHAGCTVGAMVEEPAFYPWLSGRANLRVLAGAGAPLPHRDIEAAMDRAGIAGAAGDKVKTYSQGMRQRLGLAAALMRNPAILLLDEPTNGLDPGGIRDFRSLLKDVAAEGVTVFLSSHLLTEVERLCDRVAIVHRGRLAAAGPLAELEGTGCTVRVEVDPSDEARAMELLKSRRPRRVEGGVITVAAASGREIAEQLAHGGVYPEALSVGRRSLEDVFMELTEAPHATAGV
jgi:ABC-2 type transport system ATP-binding protein